MRFSLSTEVASQLKKLKKKNPRLFKKIQKQLHLFRNNHRHPSLRLHKLKGGLSEQWSISIDKSHRMLFYESKGKAVFFAIGTHDEVYRE